MKKILLTTILVLLISGLSYLIYIEISANRESNSVDNNLVTTIGKSAFQDLQFAQINSKQYSLTLSEVNTGKAEVALEIPKEVENLAFSITFNLSPDAVLDNIKFNEEKSFSIKIFNQVVDNQLKLAFSNLIPGGEYPATIVDDLNTKKIRLGAIEYKGNLSSNFISIDSNHSEVLFNGSTFKLKLIIN